MQAVGYIRRSKKSEKGTVSLEEQAEQITSYCAKQNFQLAGIVRHDGISGAKRSRFYEIRTAIQQHNASVLVIYNLDRLARDAVALLDNLRRLAVEGVGVHEVSTGKLDLNRSASKLTIGVRGLMDEFFRDVISEKTSDALRYKKEHGQKYTRIPPFGYCYQEGCLVIDQAEQEALSFLRTCRLSVRQARAALLATGFSGRSSHGLIAKLISKQCL